MTVTYGIVEERYIFGSTSRISYGVVAYADVESDESATIVGAVHDITSDSIRLSKLVQMCNRLALSLIHLNDVVIHLNDVVEDFLAD